LRRWERAKTGEGRVVLISGEPGIGKSRLTAALSEGIGAEPHTRLRYFCSPHHQDSALYPFIVQLERAADFARDDTVEAKLGKLRALLAPGAQDDNDIALLNELLSLPNSAADITDINLGGTISGWEVAECFRTVLPNMPVLYTSGDTIDSSRCVSGSAVLAKPYQNSDILKECLRLTRLWHSS
jgi:predicted ATPase